MYAQERMLRKYGIIWIPNMSYTNKCINDAKAILSQYYTISYIHRDSLLNLNPLYCATEFVSDLLRQTPHAVTNENQMVSYLNYSDHPFIALQVLNWHAGSPPLGQDDNDDDDDEMEWQVEGQHEEEEGQREDEDDLISLPDDVGVSSTNNNSITSPSNYSIRRDASNREVVCIDIDEE